LRCTEMACSKSSCRRSSATISELMDIYFFFPKPRMAEALAAA
jgi:hypothetical protein